MGADGEDAALEGGLGDTKGGGIGTFDQFAVNERKFGVKSTYEESLYTTKLTNQNYQTTKQKRRDKHVRFLASPVQMCTLWKIVLRTSMGTKRHLWRGCKEQISIAKKSKRESTGSKTSVGTNKKRVNETVSDDRKKTTNELKTFTKD